MFSYSNKVIGVFNQKGGVGKTTIAAFIGEYGALRLGLRVLIVDTDMQCNTSEYWVGMESAPDEVGGQIPPRHPDYDGEDFLEERSTIADIFEGKSVLPYSTYLTENDDGRGIVDVLLGHPKKLEFINQHYDNPKGDVPIKVLNHLAGMLHDEDIGELYDVIIIDTGPSRNPIFRASLRAATHAVVPFEPEMKSLQGINAMLQAIGAENYSRRAEDRLTLLGLIPNKVRDNTVLHKEALESVRATKAGSVCPDNVYLPLATAIPQRDVRAADPKSIFNLPDGAKARVQAEILGDYIYGKLFADSDQPKRAATQ